MKHTKKQKEWMQTITEHGCVITGDCFNIQRHHVYGASYKHNGILIGPWYVLPLHVSLHDISSSEPINVTHNRTLFTEEHGLQKDLFLSMCNNLVRYNVELPFTADVLAAIMDTDR